MGYNRKNLGVFKNFIVITTWKKKKKKKKRKKIKLRMFGEYEKSL